MQMKLHLSSTCLLIFVCLEALNKYGPGFDGREIQIEQTPIPSHTENIYCWPQALLGGNQAYDKALEPSSFSFSSY